MKPVVYYGLIKLISDAFSSSFATMPELALIAKLIPHKIESGLFAFYSGLAILNYWFLAKIFGNLVNLYFKVTKESLDDFWKLYVVHTACTLLPLLFIWLLPSPKEV